MTNRFYSPDQQFLSNTGVPYAGGFLYFYATGTSTPQNTYSDQALTVANANPVVLDSNGQAGSIFLQNLAYKVVLTDSNNNQIWTADPVYTSDYSTYAQFQPWNGNPNGQVAGFAGTVGALPPTSAVWDYINNVLYICTTTGTAATAVWTAINGSSTTALVVAPQGYLTLSNDPNNPILTTDSISSGTVYYTPYVGNQIPVYNGSSFAITTFSQLSLTLSASQALNTIYDCFVFNNAGVLTLVTGPAWVNSGAGVGSRGTGASSTQLQRLNGIWVNAVQITAKNGSNTYTVPANTATYVGSIFVDSVAGQISCYLSYGQSRKWGVWNAYNRKRIVMTMGDATALWNYNSSTVRAANGNSANNITTFLGLPEENIRIEEVQFVTVLTVSSLAVAAGKVQIGLGLNSTTAFAGSTSSRGSGTFNYGQAAAYSAIVEMDCTAKLILPPSIGINTVTALESTITATAINVTYNGTVGNMIITSEYFG